LGVPDGKTKALKRDQPFLPLKTKKETFAEGKKNPTEGRPFLKRRGREEAESFYATM